MQNGRVNGVLGIFCRAQADLKPALDDLKTASADLQRSLDDLLHTKKT